MMNYNFILLKYKFQIKFQFLLKFKKMDFSLENTEKKDNEKNKTNNINIISQDDIININNINSYKIDDIVNNINNNINSEKNKKNNFDLLESNNSLNYNYDEENSINNSNNNNKPAEEIINELKAENAELKNDMKKLYFLTEENKKNLLEHIQYLKTENYKLKNDKKNLEYKLLVTEGKNSELIADREKEYNENKIKQQKYLNEIKELNCQLNNYKIKLNNLSLNYDQLLNDFHYINKEKI